MLKRSKSTFFVAALLLAGSPAAGTAQEPGISTMEGRSPDQEATAEDAIPETMELREGVSIRPPAAPSTAAPPPDFGIVATDASGKVIDVFGPLTPYVVSPDRSTIEIPSYELPPGGNFKLVGTAGFEEASKKALMTAYATGATPASGGVSDDIKRAVEVINDATDYIATSMCARPSRPSKLILNLSAGFTLVFSAQTGSQVEWDLEVVCPRMISNKP